MNERAVQLEDAALCRSWVQKVECSINPLSRGGLYRKEEPGGRAAGVVTDEGLPGLEAEWRIPPLLRPRARSERKQHEARGRHRERATHTSVCTL